MKEIEGNIEIQWWVVLCEVAQQRGQVRDHPILHHLILIPEEVLVISLTPSHHLSPAVTPHYPFTTSPHLTSPHLTSPHLTSPHLTSPHSASQYLPNLTKSAHTTPLNRSDSIAFNVELSPMILFGYPSAVPFASTSCKH